MSELSLEMFYTCLSAFGIELDEETKRRCEERDPAFAPLSSAEHLRRQQELEDQAFRSLGMDPPKRPRVRKF